MDVQAVKKKFSEKICDIEATIEAFRRHSENILDPGNRRKIQPVGECLDKVKKIGKAVSRDQMRVVFFGKTSNGKSTVINALLGGDVCPAGYGTTTGCFCCIEKVPEGKAKAYRPSTIVPAQAPNGPRNNIPQRHGVGEDEEAEDDAKGEWIPLEDGALKDIISKFGEHTLTSKYVVHVRWPEEQCPLLVDDVAIIDTPGIDANAMDDGNIGVMCTDADVFVYVCDGKGTIEQREMDFLKRVQQCVSNLTENNLFIAVNWWDLVEKKGEAFQVKKQLVDRVTKFLKKEFGFHEESVQRRVFCISGEEALATPKPGSTDITAGQKLRQKAFDKFKEALLHCLTEDGLKTRFGRHCGSLRESVGTLCKCVSEVIGVIDRRQASVELKIENLDECCVNLDQGVEDLESQRCSRHEDTVIVAIVGIVVAKVNEARQRVPVVVRNCANVYQFHGVEEFKKQALADVQLSYDAINADLERELETIYLVGEKELTRVYRNCFQEYSSLQGQQAEPRPGVEPEPVPLNQIGVENNDLPWLKAENVAIKPRRMCDCDVVSTWVFACLIGVIAIYMKGLNAVWTIILLAGAAWFANKIWPQLFSDSMKEEVKEQVIARLCSQLDGKAVMMKQNFVACLENRLKEQSAACQVTLKGWQEVLNDESRNFQDELEKTKEDIGKLKEFRTEFISEQNWLNTFGDELHK